MIVTTGPSVERHPNAGYLGANVFRDAVATITDTVGRRSGTAARSG